MSDAHINHPARPKVSRWHDPGEPPPVVGKRKKEPEENKEDKRDKDDDKSSNKKRASQTASTNRSSDLYETIEKIGEGTYGSVYKARCRENNQLVALKKLKLESETEGFPITSIRESITLLKGKHPNVINVQEIVFSKSLDHVYIVMDYMDRDLKSLMHDMKRPFKMAEIKLLMTQIIEAVAHLHNNWIIHRDLKTSNLLIHKGVLKLGDFGLAREYGSPLKQYTNKVVTLWYRAPELLLNTGKYSTPIDVWSIGCIFGELLLQKPLFPGQSEIQQIDLIFKALGSPSEDLWPEYEKIRLVQKVKFPHYKYNRLLDMLDDRKALSDKGFHLWNKLLAYDPGVKSGSDKQSIRPTHRITAEHALKHEFFQEEPKPIHPSLFPTWPKDSSRS
uniref:cyclin-dependent kinase n=1 Tax=Aceria tosichella TaxID=561515 RepID=A0A6G1SFX1_9ACAR